MYNLDYFGSYPTDSYMQGFKLRFNFNQYCSPFNPNPLLTYSTEQYALINKHLNLNLFIEENSHEPYF